MVLIICYVKTLKGFTADYVLTHASVYGASIVPQLRSLNTKASLKKGKIKLGKSQKLIVESEKKRTCPQGKRLKIMLLDHLYRFTVYSLKGSGY